MPPENVLLFFAKYIETELGIVYAEHNFFQLQNRLEEIAKLLGIHSVDHLFEHAQSGITGPFKQLLLDIATNNETSFFRDLKVFRAIENAAIPSFAAQTPCMPKLSIWSAASSSGQEALSVAMTLLEWNQKNGKTLDFKITGTDISERILSKAKAARYTQLEIQRGLPAPLMIKYFQKDLNDFWTANADLTRHIEYKKLNLTENFEFSQPYDLILCRNVLIYQNIERKVSILKKIHSALSPGGFLILGSGESLIGLSDGFTQVLTDGAVIYCKKDRLATAA